MAMTPAEEFASAFGGGDATYTAELLARALGASTPQPAPVAAPASTTAPTSLPGKLPANMLAAFGLDNPHYLNALAAEAAAGIPYTAPTVYPGAPTSQQPGQPSQPSVQTPGNFANSGGLTMSASPYAAMLAPQQMQPAVGGKTPTSNIYAAMQQARGPNSYQNYLNTFQNILNAPRSVVPQLSVTPAPAPAPVSNIPTDPRNPTNNPNYISPTGPNSGTDWASMYGG